MTDELLCCQCEPSWACSTPMEKTSKNSLKLTETLGELEAALKAWDSSDGAALGGIEVCTTGLSDERKKRARELLDELRSQIEQLSSGDPL